MSEWWSKSTKADLAAHIVKLEQDVKTAVKALSQARNDALEEAVKVMRAECIAPEGTYHPVDEKDIMMAELATVELATSFILELKSQDTE